MSDVWYGTINRAKAKAKTTFGDDIKKFIDE
jgi:hypothetical protein